MRMMLQGGGLIVLLISVVGCIAEPPVPITRADLAASYLELEQVFFATAPDDAVIIADINRRFDQATLAFFSADSQGAIRQIEQLVAELRPPRTVAARAAASLKRTIEPPVYIVGSGSAATLRLSGMYPIAANAELALKLKLTGADGVAVSETAITVKANSDGFADEKVTLDGVASLQPGAARIELLDEDGTPLAVWKWDVVSRSLDARAAENTALLGPANQPDDPVLRARTACRARNRLLKDRPSESNAAQYLVDLEALANDVAAEAAEVSAGRDPYVRRTGRYWRAILSGVTEIPAWVFAPAAARDGRPLPLVIALHGAGGDEAMFIYGYGAGRLLELAEQHGFLVVSPATSLFGSSFTHFDAVLDTIGDVYALDRDRVYVIGHSMGTGAAAGLAVARSEQIAAVCCIAGSPRLANMSKLAPLLGILGQLDPLAPPSRAEPAFRAAQDAGLPVEYRVLPNYGHTLLVGAELPAAIEWLLARSRIPANAKPARTAPASAPASGTKP